jgi:hypothetical protein
MRVHELTHLGLVNASSSAALVIGLTTFLFTGTSGRALGVAIVAHVVFTAMVVLPGALGSRALLRGHGQFGGLASDELAGCEADDAALLCCEPVVWAA